MIHCLKKASALIGLKCNVALLCYVLTVAFISTRHLVTAQESTCLAKPEFNQVFVDLNGGSSIPLEGSCCQKDVCNLPCPAISAEPGIGYGIGVGIIIFVSFAFGLMTCVFVGDKSENYFVAGHSLPTWIVAITLGAQAVDSNSLLGNVDLAYSYSFYDGAVIPIGLGLSLMNNAIFLAHKINEEKSAFTLIDILSKRYGKTVEVLLSLVSITSFIMLLAGNLVGMGFICSYVWGTSKELGIWLAAVIIWIYTVGGGLFSVAYTDIIQGGIGWSGCIVAAYWMIANAAERAPPPSVGFPGYIYPSDEICDKYLGIPCENNQDLCCYNSTNWCDANGDNCFTDNGAYPYGDKSIYSDQMFNAQALTPFPNSIMWNWATIIILGFVGALDFQVRCLACKSPNGARIACIVGSLFVFFIGIPFSYLGSITRYYYGPDSIYAEFSADTCATILGLPTCGQWIPDTQAFFKLMTNQIPPALGAWCMMGIVAASMSTSDGAILAMGTVFSHNVVRQFDAMYPSLITPDNLLTSARISTLPFTIIAAILAAFYQQTGYLLIVAFDIVFACMITPLFGCFYAKNPSPRAALCSILTGIILRVTLEFVLPKDGLLVLPLDFPEFDNYGPAASTLLPTFVDGPAGSVWDPSIEPCEQEKYSDYTGVDSLAAFGASMLVFIIIQFVEHKIGRPIFYFPGDVGYEKDLGDDKANQSHGDVDKSVARTIDIDQSMKPAIVDFNKEEEVA